MQELDMLDVMFERTGARHDLSWYPIQWAQVYFMCTVSQKLTFDIEEYLP